ncbi:flagellar assembly protein A, partial [Leptospira sp. SA-E8]|uniref:flagellar assembly protein A n=1 Tax=Leptospira sp. SA-E8 TaxID=3422259 RepID=UPI003EB8945A
VAERAPQVNEQGLIDFRELGEIPFVQPGTPLMRRHPATLGVAGCDVRGNPVNPTPGADIPYATVLKGVRFAPGDPNVLEAEIKGQPVHVENGMLVEDLLSLETVDMDSGNVSFDGSIQIKGDVMANMKVKVTGNIIIGGTVEGAELEAGGDIQIGRGVIAHAKV